MSYSDIKEVATANLEDWPTNLPKEFPEFEDNVVLPDSKTFAERNERLAIEQATWDEDKIGILPKSELFYNGLSPVDFLRAFHDKHDNLDKIEREAYEHGNMTFRNWTDSILHETD